MFGGPGATNAARSFVVCFGALAAGALAAVLALNVLVDPTEDWATGLVPSFAYSPRLRKVELLSAWSGPPPRLVVLGSSRAMKLEPAVLAQKTGLPAFNAAVNAAMLEDDLALMAWMLDDRRLPLDTVVLALDVEAFHGAAPINRQLLASPHLVRHLGLALPERVRATVERLGEALTGARLGLSLKTLWYAWRGKIEPSATFSPDGVVHYPAWERALAAGTFEPAPILARTIDEYRERFRDYVRLDPRRVAWLGALYDLAASRGVRVIAYLTPLHPQAVEVLSRETAYARLHDEVRDLAARTAREHGLTFLDLSDLSSFGGSAELFFDAAHMREENARRLLDVLFPGPGGRHGAP